MKKNNEDKKRIGRRIREIRQEKHLTQGQLSNMTGLSQSHIARIEAGMYSVSFDTLQVIASALGCTVDMVGV